MCIRDRYQRRVHGIHYFMKADPEICILIIGAPASGKGTHGGRIKDKYGFYHLASGDLLREEVKNKTPIGVKAKDIMNAGKLVPDEIIFEIIGKTLEKPECKRVMFDGFPRTLDQAHKLAEFLVAKNKKLVGVIYLKVEDEELLLRSCGRRFHPASGRTYHVKFNPPKVEGKDDITGEPLIQRDDDKEETMKTRIALFHKNNEPILKLYGDQNLLHTVEIPGKLEDNWKKVDAAMQEVMKTCTKQLILQITSKQ
eukprot:TRINITY_DN605_c0_g1_i1.p1 TRINITY_DN605_c0_g1~~TRINITY_DN605_c0_g1_i1.p1  ORF type:complete len:254 (+),score=96.46 TRINITY_DN605_c0_g1_i1:65-826(+)